jgi:hypothetical protein
MPESIMVLGIKHGQNSKPNKREIIMKKDYGRLGLPNLLEAPVAKTAAPTVVEEIVAEEVVTEAVVVIDDSAKDSKKAKSKKWSDLATDEPEEAAQVPAE